MRATHQSIKPYITRINMGIPKYRKSLFHKAQQIVVLNFRFVLVIVAVIGLIRDYNTFTVFLTDVAAAGKDRLEFEL